MCVPDGDWDAGSKMDKVCGKSNTEYDCVTGKGEQKRCRWATGVPTLARPPVFVCSSGEWVYAKGECGYDEPAGKTTISTKVEAACSFIEESGCYLLTADNTCDISKRSECFGIVKTAMKNCKIGCLNFNSASKDPKCGQCVEDALFKTRTIDSSVPDIYTCCSCLDPAFAAIGVPSSEVDRMLQLTCPTEGYYGGYDYEYDDDSIFDDDYQYDDDSATTTTKP